MFIRITRFAKTTPDSQRWPSMPEMLQNKDAYPEPLRTQINEYIEAFQQMQTIAVFANTEAQYTALRDADETLFTFLGFPDPEDFVAYDENRAQFQDVVDAFKAKRDALLESHGVEMTVYAPIEHTVEKLVTLTLEDTKALLENAEPVVS